MMGFHTAGSLSSCSPVCNSTYRINAMCMQTHTQMISYKDLFTSFRKGLKNGNWRRLKFMDKALYRAAMEYANRGQRGCVVNGKLVEKLRGLIEKLKETNGMRIFKRGLDKAIELLETSAEKGVFVWAPSLRYWLKDPNYIFWLGTVR